MTAEENIHGYFWGELKDDQPNAEGFKRYGVPGNSYNWGAYESRFDIAKEANEASEAMQKMATDHSAAASGTTNLGALLKAKLDTKNTEQSQ